MACLNQSHEVEVVCIVPAALTVLSGHKQQTNPLKPHFYIVKLAYTGVYIIFLISSQT